MDFYPRSLKRDWYMADVCDSIHASLEGTKQWTKYYYENECERNAYIDMFEQCQALVKEHDMKPKAMLQALSDLHTEVTTFHVVYPFFSLGRWVYKPNEAREQAVIIAFKLVDGISSRFLP